MQIILRSDLQAQLLHTIAAAIDSQLVPQLQTATRVDTGALRESTRMVTAEDRLYVVQGGLEACDYAVWVELKFGDFGSALAAVDWDFR